MIFGWADDHFVLSVKTDFYTQLETAVSSVLRVELEHIKKQKIVCLVCSRNTRKCIFDIIDWFIHVRYRSNGFQLMAKVLVL